MVDGILGDRYAVVLCDLDGVVYAGPNPIPGAPEGLGRQTDRGRVLYVTNNAARTPATVSAQLNRYGLATTDDDIVTSAQAGVAVLARILAEQGTPSGPVLIVGGDGLRTAAAQAGLTEAAGADDAAAIVQGFAETVSWLDLAEAAYAAARGIPWVATNTDRTIPRERGIAPGNGMLVGAVSAACGRTPVVTGKPEKPIFDAALARVGVSDPSQGLMIGDRLDTDIEGGRAAGLDALAVLSGVTDLPGIVDATGLARPNYVARTAAGLGQPLADCLQDHGTGVVVGDTDVELPPTAGPTQAGLLLADLLHRSWQRADAGRPVPATEVAAAAEALLDVVDRGADRPESVAS